MTFSTPAWFILIPFLALAGWRWRGLKLHEPLRALSLLLIVTALTGPRSRWGDDGRDVWVLVDRSSSDDATITSSLPEWQQLLERHRGRADRLFYVDFAHSPVRRDRGDPVFRGGTGATRLGAAVRYTLNEIDPARPTRLLVLTDGQSTDSLANAAESLIRARVALDYRLALPAQATDYQVAQFRTPSEVEPGASFLLDAAIDGLPDATIPWELIRNGAPAGHGDVSIRNGIAHLRLTDRLAAPGVARYEFRIKPTVDAHPENNRATAVVQAGARGRVLLVTAYADDPVARVLRESGASVEIVTNATTLDAGHLTGARVVILHNIPAWKVAREFLAALDFFVRNQGGGLLMIGGRASFASGGYFQSPVDELLPVSMEMRQDQRKLAVALAIVMDRSGSMAVGAGNGETKMDLADAGAATSAQLLGDTDFISIHAVDSEAHEIVPLARVGPNRAMIESVVRRVSSMGGGIFVYEGLEAGWKELQKATVGQRHLVLFSDANDSEEPGDYKTLLAEMRKGGATVSVIGLGTEHDSDADLLKDIAERGNGRIFFSADASQLPQIFAQETVTIARSAFIDEPAGLNPTPGWREIAAQPLAWLPEIDGYNLSYLRPGATAAAFSKDDYTAPLVASWQRGAGRVAAVTFPLGGDFSERTRAWVHYGDFTRTLARWLMGDDLPPGLGLQTVIDGDELKISLFVDDPAGGQVIQPAPALVVATGAGGSATDVPWERIAPGEFQARVPLPVSSWLRGAVQVGTHAIPFGPFAASAQAEWLVLPERVDALRALARESGGGERLDLADIWKAPIARASSDVQPWLLAGALFAFLADAILTRLGIGLLKRR